MDAPFLTPEQAAEAEHLFQVLRRRPRGSRPGRASQVGNESDLSFYGAEAIHDVLDARGIRPLLALRIITRILALPF